MKKKTNLLGVLLLLALNVSAADRWWNGLSTDSVMDATKWSGKMIPTESDDAKINDGEKYQMTVSSGDTISCKNFILGVTWAGKGNSLTMNGGTISVADAMSIAYYANSSAIVTVNDGNLSASNIELGKNKNAEGSFFLKGGTVTVDTDLNVSQANDATCLFKMTGGVLNIGKDLNINSASILEAKGRFEMTGGTINMASGKAFSVPRYGHATGTMSGANAVINFNGAYFHLDSSRSWHNWTEGHGEFTLSDGATFNGPNRIQLNGPDSVFTCNGGIFVCGTDGDYFNGDGKICVGDGGITIDTNGKDVKIVNPLLAAEGATSGGLVKKGIGKLTLGSSNTYLPGPVDIQAGTVFAPGPNALPGYASCEFKLAEGARLELGGAWSPSQIATIKALPNVRGVVEQTTHAIEEDTVFSENLTAQDVADGKIANPMTGSHVLKLTGKNDFGGEFRVNSGVLAADFGQGLATTDHLTLGEDDGFNKSTPALFAPLNGLVSCNIGTGPGEISFGSNTEAGFAGVVPTTVKLFNDETRALTGNAEIPRKLVFNSVTANNDVHFLNPIAMTSDFRSIDVAVLTGEAYLDGYVQYFDNDTPAKGGSLTKKEAGTLHMPSVTTLGTVHSHGGTLSFPARSTVKLNTLSSDAANAVADFGENTTFEASKFDIKSGKVVFNKGSKITTGGEESTFCNSSQTIFSNASWKVTSHDVVVKARNDSTADGGVLIKGGTFENTGGGWMQVQDGGTFIFDGCTAKIKPAFISGRTSVTKNPTSKTIVRGGAKLEMSSFVTMHGETEIDGEDTLIKTSDGFKMGDTDTGASASGPGKVLIKNGRIESSGDIRIGNRSGSVSLLRIEGGSVWVASGKSIAVGCAGNGTLEVAGGLIDAAAAKGIAILPQWQDEEKEYKKTPPGGLLRLLGGEVKAQKIYGDTTRGRADVDFDGGKVAFVSPSEITIFSGVSSCRLGVNGGEIDVGEANLKMSMAFTALTNQEAIAVSGAQLNTAKAFVKSGTGTLTMVGANASLCGTEVRAGILSLASGATLPSDRFIRVNEGAKLDLGGANQTVTALLGTGEVKSGAITVTEAIYPAGVGVVGTLTLTDVTPAGKVVIDSDEEGNVDRLVVNGTLDASKLTFELANVANIVRHGGDVCFATASSITGVPKILNMPKNYFLSTAGSSISVKRARFSIIIR